MKKEWHFCHQQPATTFIEKYDGKWYIRSVDDRILYRFPPRLLKSKTCPYCNEKLKVSKSDKQLNKEMYKTFYKEGNL